MSSVSQRDFPLALHTWSLDTTPLKDALAAAKQARFDAMELRRIDFTRLYERGLSNDAVLDLIRASGIKVCTLGVEYGLIFAEGAESVRLFDVFRQSCANAVALGCDLVMCAPGQSAGALDDAVANVRVAADIAGELGVRLAIEFNAQHDVINRLEVLHELLDRVDRSNCGMILDAYHLHRSGHPGRAFEEVPAEMIFAFQYSDVPDASAGGIRRPIDRLLPGQGLVRWSELFQLLAEKSYAGYLSFEAPNPVLWERPALEVASQAAEATRRLMRDALQAEMT